MLTYRDHNVFGERAFETMIREGMWVRVKRPEDHEICNFHNPRAKLWSEVARGSSGSDDLGRNLRTDAHGNHSWVETFTCETQPPDAGTGP